jgi:hypothetical protein
MADIFREVDEEVRRDKAAQVWEKYQNLIIGAALLVILATGAWKAWEYVRIGQAQTAAAQYESAIDLHRQAKFAESEKALAEMVAKAPAGYQQIGKLRGAIETSMRDQAEGVKAFDALAGDQSLDPLFRDVARLRAAILRIDAADAAETARRLEPMAEAGQPFRATARELLGVKALETGDFDRAAKYLDMIVVDSAAPPSIRQRAELLLGLVRAGKPTTAN